MTTADLVGRLRAAGCVFAEDEARLLTDAARDPAELAALLNRRLAGEPLEYVLGWVEFAGLRILVDPGVFVPRQRTVYLVERAAREAPPHPVVLDLCCGTGALGVALVHAAGPTELHAADLDPAAVRCARRNVEPLGGTVHLGDLFDPLPESLRGRVDVLMANAPYVPSAEIATMPPEARDHEHRVALDGGSDGLDILRRVIAGAPGWLAPTGRLLVESSVGQAPALSAAFTAAGMTPRVARSKKRGSTVVVGTTQGSGDPTPELGTG